MESAFTLESLSDEDRMKSIDVTVSFFVPAMCAVAKDASVNVGVALTNGLAGALNVDGAKLHEARIATDLPHITVAVPV